MRLPLETQGPRSAEEIRDLLKRTSIERLTPCASHWLSFVLEGVTKDRCCSGNEGAEKGEIYQHECAGKLHGQLVVYLFMPHHSHQMCKGIHNAYAIGRLSPDIGIIYKEIKAGNWHVSNE